MCAECSANATKELADHATKHSWDDVDAKSNAHYQAACAVDLSSHGRAKELHEHGKGVQAEGEATNWRWQVGRLVGLSASTTNFSLVGLFSAQNIDSHADLASAYGFSIFVLADQVHPERVFLFMELPLFSLLKRRCDLVLVVGLSESDGSLGKGTILKQLSEVDLATAKNVVTLEEISIKHLHSESIVTNHLLVIEEVFGVDETVVPTRLLTWLQSVVGVCLQRVFAGVEEASHEDIGAVILVRHVDVLSVEDGHTELKFFWGLGLHIVDRLHIFFRHFSGVNLYPHADLSLRQVHARVEDLTSFSRLVFQGVPFW